MKVETSETSQDLTAPSVSRPVVLLCVLGGLLVGFAVGDRLANQDGAIVVDTYCSPIFEMGGEDVLRAGLGLQVQVMRDGSERTALVDPRTIDGLSIYSGLCRPPVPAPSSIDVRNDPLFP